MTRVSSARQDWAQGYRRFLDASHEPGRADSLHEQLEVVTGAIRRRLGGAFTLRELAEAYATSDDWAREAVDEHAPSPRVALTLADATDAAFHLYSRGAQDYVP